MNKKWIIGALVGGFIVFFWQFLSWTLLNLHGPNQKYTPNQENIIDCLSTNLTEDGTYFIPNLPQGATSEEQQKAMESSAGKPWAIVSYRKSFNTSMGMNMFRGFTADIVAVLLLCWIFSLMPSINMKSAVMVSVGIGLIGYFTTSYALSIWYELNSIPELLDVISSWALCGIWLGFWLKK